MIFESRYQHSNSQIQILNQLSQKKNIDLPTSLFLATEATQHGLKDASSIISKIENQYPLKEEIKLFLSSLRSQVNFIENIPELESFRKNQDSLKKLYELNGYNFFKGEKNPEKLIIIFTTMFNNFYVSNPVLVALLSQFGISILLLKDATRFNYLKGVEGLGIDLSTLARNIQEIISKNNIDEVYITGFSSGGYSSLFLSSVIKCKKYLGFSIRSNLSETSKYPPKYFTDEVKNKIPKEWLINLKDRLNLEDSPCIRNIYVGEKSPLDLIHANNLTNVRNLTINTLYNCGHITIARLMENNKLTDIFRALIFDT